ncbi:AAA family ATPase [Cellulomonas hominis]
MAHAQRFDITRVRLRHYRSIASCDVHLGPLTLLVGPNGSGKSNFVDSLRFVSQSLGENLDNALRERGGVAEVRRRSTGHPTHFGISVDFQGPLMTGSYSFRVAAVKGGDYRVSQEDCVIRRAEFGAADSGFSVRDGVVVESSIGAALPRPAPDRLFLVFASAVDEFRPVYDGLAGISVFNLNPGVMRELQKPDSGELLRRDGSNVASVLESLRRTDPATKQKIEDYLRLIVPSVTSADRRGLGSWETVEFRQLVAGSDDPWVFPASSMSDGTLRALGILVALFAPSESGFSPIGIEEPETALHPAAAGLLLEALQSASLSRQVMATSHSPELLDSVALRPEHLVAVRADHGVSRLGPIDEAGESALRESLYTAGELLRVDQLQPALVDDQRMLS